MLSNKSIYASLCSSTWSHLLCSKLCQHNLPTPSGHVGPFMSSFAFDVVLVSGIVDLRGGGEVAFQSMQ